MSAGATTTMGALADAGGAMAKIMALVMAADPLSAMNLVYMLLPLIPLPVQLGSSAPFRSEKTSMHSSREQGVKFS
jgi:hypothetical protein